MGFRSRKSKNSTTTLAVRERDAEAPSGKSVTRTTDAKGRVALGGRFANRHVIVQPLSDTEMIIKIARVIPESEAWLYDNPEAFGAVRAGLAQARGGQVAAGPDLDADAHFAADLED